MILEILLVNQPFIYIIVEINIIQKRIKENELLNHN